MHPFALLLFIAVIKAQLNGLLTEDGCFQKWEDRQVLCAKSIATMQVGGEVAK
jgi:hypothetical protein